MRSLWSRMHCARFVKHDEVIGLSQRRLTVSWSRICKSRGSSCMPLRGYLLISLTLQIGQHNMHDRAYESES
jgi:hypothetical protein